MTPNWEKMRTVYRIFAEGEYHSLDFSDEAAEMMYQAETHGLGILDPRNGYLVGKRLMDITIKVWRQDIANGLLMKWELYEDPIFKNIHCWLDKVLGNV